MKRLLASILILPMLVLPVQAESIRWVDFNVPYESMKYALDQDIATFEQEKHISWIDILALAACRTGGKCALASVKQAVSDLKKDKQPEQLLGDLYKYYDYYHRAYTAALGGLVGSYAIEKDGQWVATYGALTVHGQKEPTVMTDACEAVPEGVTESTREETQEPEAEQAVPCEEENAVEPEAVDEELNRIVAIFKLAREQGYTLKLIPGTPEENAPVFDFENERILRPAA